MRLFRTLAALSVVLALTACAAQPPASSPSSAPAPAAGGILAGTLIDDRVATGLELVYNVPAHAYVTADAAGLITPALKARLKPILANAYAALQVARAAKAVVDSGSASPAQRTAAVAAFSSASESVRAFAGQASALIPRAPG